jgi:hypothetical protein
MHKVTNPSIGNDDRWTNDGLTFEEVIHQSYSNSKFSAGVVEGHPDDTMYIRWEKPEIGSDGMLLLTPDEVAAIAWCATGLLWSHLIPRK